MKAVSTVLAFTVTLTACSPSDESHLRDRPWRQAGDVTDSLVPMAEMVFRFRKGVPETGSLEGGAASVDDFAANFIAALTAADSSRLDSLRVSTAEFAWLLAERHLYTRPPYDLDPALLWLQISAGSDKGMRRLLDRLGRRRLVFRSIACEQDTLQFPDTPQIRAWKNCQMHWQLEGQESSGRLFGTLVERDGVFKVLGYGNDY